MPIGSDPAEGDRRIIERALARQDSDPTKKSAKNPEQEAENPGGRPSPAVKGSHEPSPSDPEGQQGSTQHAPNPTLVNPQRGN
jgi:hypothetical protein